jgi:hypothetical protein
VFKGGHRGRGGVVVVDPAKYTPGGDGHAALGQPGAHLPGVPAIQKAIAERHPLGRGERLLLGRAHGRQVRVGPVTREPAERGLLGEDAGSVIVIAVAEDERLGEEPLGAEGLRGGSRYQGPAAGSRSAHSSPRAARTPQVETGR